MFQGEPFAEEDYEQAIEEVWEAEKKYNPSVIGYEWTRIILEFSWSHWFARYIEFVPIKPV